MPADAARKDQVRLLHMRDAAMQAMAFNVGRTRDSLDRDDMFRRAVLHCIQEIGEAAVHVDDSTKQFLPDIPWKEIIQMRNRVVHVYFSVKNEYVWEVLTKDLPELLRVLTPHLNQ